MLNATPDYSMTVDDLAGLHAILKAQGLTGAGMPPPGQAGLLDFFGVINDIAFDHYRLAANASLKRWMERLVQVLIETDTCYTIEGKKLTAAGMYLLYLYYQFNETCMYDAWSDPLDDCIKHGFPHDGDKRGGKRLTDVPDNEKFLTARPWCFFCADYTLCYVPGALPDLYNALGINVNLLNKGLFMQRGSTDTVAITEPGPMHSIDQVKQFQQSHFDPANWTDSSVFVQNLQKAAWQDQSSQLTAMLKQHELASDGYFYLLHLLIGLGTSGTANQQLAQKIASAPVSSMEYQNDTLINQLVYLTLMYLADPAGSYGYDNAELQSLLTASATLS